jgi:hypothetical protein
VTTTPAEMGERLSRHDISVYAALDNVAEIHQRIKNLLTGRDFTVIRRYVVDRPYTFPEVETNCVLNHEDPKGAVSMWVDKDQGGGGVAVRYGATFNLVGIPVEYRTEREAADAAHSGSHRDQQRTVVYVQIEGGHTPDAYGLSSVINIVRTNQNGVAEQIVLKPRVVQSNDEAEVEGVFLDRVAAHIDATGEPLTAEQVRALAESVRYNWKSGLRSGPA